MGVKYIIIQSHYKLRFAKLFGAQMFNIWGDTNQMCVHVHMANLAFCGGNSPKNVRNISQTNTKVLICKCRDFSPQAPCSFVILGKVYCLLSSIWESLRFLLGIQFNVMVTIYGFCVYVCNLVIMS